LDQRLERFDGLRVEPTAWYDEPVSVGGTQPMSKCNFDGWGDVIGEVPTTEVLVHVDMRSSLKVTLSGTVSQGSLSCRSVDRPQSNSSGGVEHSLQLICDRLRSSCIDSIAIINP